MDKASGAQRKTRSQLRKSAVGDTKGFDMVRIADLTARLRACYTGAVHDVLRGMGHERIVLPPEIKAIEPSTRLAGPVWTVSGHIDRTQSRHDTLLGWCTLLSKTPAAHVVICQPNNHEVALMGELSAQTLKARGVLGYIVDGGSRDTDLVLDERFPVFCSFLTPSDIVERWIPDRFAQPITIGDVTIRTGDWVLADRDGVVIIPGDIVDEVVGKTEEVVRTESTMRKALIGGMDPVAAYLKYGKF
jgi:4-hydroxy-4-methyl-2-oxoglutarate aldolase